MKIFVVGGAVRDVILNRKPKDIDFVVVGSTPEEMIEKGFSQVGADFPVFLDDHGQEFALARTERKSGSGHKGFETEFGSTVTLEDDLFRRDLTINAMAVAVDDWDSFVKFGDNKFLIDPFGGLEDIKNQTLRHVSEAFREDPLRVLRVARFAARMGFGIHRDTLRLMSDMVASGELEELTKERVWSEMSRAMCENFPHLFFNTLNEINGIEVIATDSSVFTGLNERLIDMVKANVSPMVRWMGIFFDTHEDAVEEFLELHKIPNDIAIAIRFSLFMHSAVFSGVEDIIDVCKKFRLWHDNRMSFMLLHEFHEMIRIVDPDSEPKFVRVKNSILQSAKVDFISLSQEERDTLSGPDIGLAIEKKRKEIIGQAIA